MTLTLNSPQYLTEVKIPLSMHSQPSAVTSLPTKVAPKGLEASTKDLKKSHTFTIAERTDPNMQPILMLVSKFDNIFDNINLSEGLSKEKLNDIIKLVKAVPDETSDQILVPPGLASSKVTNVLHLMNFQLESLSRKLTYLCEAIEVPSNSNEVPYYKILFDTILKHYWSLYDHKVEFVKMHFAENPAYAMAIPVTLPAGSTWYSCGSLEKMKKIFTEGFGSYINFERKATIIEKLDTGLNIGLDMGENGVYFSLDIPSYLNVDMPFGFKALLTKPLPGFAIRSVSELYRLGKEEGFTIPQIEEAYKKLIRISNFIRHDGPTSIFRTEVVFLKPESVVQPISIVTLQDGTNIYHSSVKEYLESLHPDHPPMTQHHSFPTSS